MIKVIMALGGDYYCHGTLIQSSNEKKKKFLAETYNKVSHFFISHYHSVKVTRTYLCACAG